MDVRVLLSDTDICENWKAEEITGESACSDIIYKKNDRCCFVRETAAVISLFYILYRSIALCDMKRLGEYVTTGEVYT